MRPETRWLVRAGLLAGVAYVALGCALFRETDEGFVPIVEGLKDAGEAAFDNLGSAGGGPLGWVHLAGSALVAGFGGVMATLRGKRKQERGFLKEQSFRDRTIGAFSDAFERLKSLTENGKPVNKDVINESITAEIDLAELSPRSFREVLKRKKIPVGRTTPPE